MKKIKDAIISTIAAIIVLFLSGWLCVMGSITLFKLTLLGECLSWECAPKRPFTVVDLGLPSSLFPDGTTWNSIEYFDDDDARTDRTGYQEFYWKNRYDDRGTYTVEMFTSNRNSSWGFSREKASFFSDWGNTKILWLTPKELIYKSSLADNFFMACGKINNNDYRCGAIARYQEFVIFLKTPMNDNMGYQDFQKMVIYMDKQISNQLYQK